MKTEEQVQTKLLLKLGKDGPKMILSVSFSGENMRKKKLGKIQTRLIGLETNPNNGQRATKKPDRKYPAGLEFFLRTFLSFQ
ncbi:MAG: hypothetical protein NTY33_04360 [Candidatus Moranbacteria bacterium]|nr:hypothetical protein [Candidatus Moranbacteria bacterium]